MVFIPFPLPALACPRLQAKYLKNAFHNSTSSCCKQAKPLKPCNLQRCMCSNLLVRSRISAFQSTFLLRLYGSQKPALKSLEKAGDPGPTFSFASKRKARRTKRKRFLPLKNQFQKIAFIVGGHSKARFLFKKESRRAKKTTLAHQKEKLRSWAAKHPTSFG